MPKSTEIKKGGARVPKKTLTLDDVLDHIVEVRSSLGHKIVQFLFDKQEEYIPEICERIIADGGEASVQAQCALEGMTMAALAPGEEELRTQYAVLLANTLLASQLNDYARCSIIQQLQLLKVPEVMPCLLCMMSQKEPLFSTALAAFRSILLAHPMNDLVASAYVELVHASRGNRRLALALPLVEQNFMEDASPILARVFQKSPEQLNDYELALLSTLAYYGNREAKDSLLEMLSSSNSVLKARARRSLSMLVFAHVDKGFRNAVEEDMLSPEDEADYGKYGNEDEAAEKDEYECHCGSQHKGEDAQDEAVEEARPEDYAEEDDDVDADEDYDSQACALAKEYFEREPKAPALYSLLMAVGDTKMTFRVCVDMLKDNMLEGALAARLLDHGFTGVEFSEMLLNEALDERRKDIKAKLVYILGCRGDEVARNFIMSALYDKDPVVRDAARRARQVCQLNPEIPDEWLDLVSDALKKGYDSGKARPVPGK